MAPPCARCWTGRLPQEAKAGLYELLAEAWTSGVREPDAEYLVRRALTEQDRTLYALCRPERLLRMACCSPSSTAGGARSPATSSTSPSSDPGAGQASATRRGRRAGRHHLAHPGLAASR